MKKHSRVSVLFVVSVLCIFGIVSFAQAEVSEWISGIEVLSGYASGNLKTPQEDYEMVPLIVDIDLDLKPLIKKLNIDPPMLVQFQLEPFISTVINPDPNVEIGNAFAVKAGIFPDTWALQPYLKVACGMVYMTQHTIEQGTQFNFIEYGGGGLHYFFSDGWAATIEGRFRHLSN
ncbi:MAG: acyloxyacyl hydrolase, partial [Candidatus Omnitrophica bacterium]|nr:acyloxyacyl hydrolase [Candidatus Omnitrophota bacterium]